MLPKTQMEHLQNSAKQENIDLAGFDQILQPIIDSCTKDSIGTGGLCFGCDKGACVDDFSFII